jgi:hypothetical protein
MNSTIRDRLASLEQAPRRQLPQLLIFDSGRAVGEPEVGPLITCSNGLRQRYAYCRPGEAPSAFLARVRLDPAAYQVVHLPLQFGYAEAPPCAA